MQTSLSTVPQTVLCLLWKAPSTHPRAAQEERDNISYEWNGDFLFPYVEVRFPSPSFVPTAPSLPTHNTHLIYLNKHTCSSTSPFM